ncbi:helix-turn-helix transcriptional regulator [Phytohabitans sp. LJ34]|uniref:helix-turn-helix transcriptional regulator n=1 Tax=Phytohabitans sp. LJ34 TaxID=3452217 RepID=UPI003F8C8BD8
MPRRRVATALDELASVQAATAFFPSVAKEPVWRASPPAKVNETLRRMRVRHVMANAGIRRPSSPLALLTDVPTALGDDLRHLPSRAVARARLARLAEVAHQEQLAMHPEPTFDAETRRAAAPMDRTLLERGVQMRVLGVQPVDPDGFPSVPAAPQPAYRMSRRVPAKLIIVDRKVAVFPVAPDNPERGYLEVAQETMVSALVAMFEREWHRADDPPTLPARLTLHPRERAVVARLAEGHTDASAARDMLISPRTVANILRRLMDRLGVENRFQLGLALGAAHAVALPQPDHEGEL